MNYEEKYKSALEWMRSIYPTMQGADKEDAEHYFPELRESDDEKIRKRLIAMCKHYIECYALDPYNIDDYKEALAWLEKQNEQKPVFEMKTPEESLGIDSDTYNKIVDECIYGEQKPANKVEPKFKIGDNIEPIDSCLGSPLTIYKICDGFYETNQGTLDFEFENNWRLIEQKPACSEEDEVKINRIVACLENLNVADNDILLKDVDWLKSLRPQSQWKPSDEQMDELRKYSDNVVLRNLYYNLKKLKVE
jgi:hypothetical protein